jgi:hypothetical protein
VAAGIRLNVNLALCEPSGVFALPDGRLVVVDDEEQRTAWVLTLGATGVESRTPMAIPRTKDLEAVAGVGETVLLMGSHSRRGDSTCSIDGRRMRAVRGQVVGAALTAPQPMSMLGGDDAALKKKTLAAARGGLMAHCDANNAALCNAIAEAEAAAAGDPDACAHALNIEGASVIAGRVWLGLRAPRIGQDALMVRLAGDLMTMQSLVFDGHAQLDLGGRGVRGLAADATHVYGIAGPVGDSDSGSFELFRAPIAAFKPGARVVPQIVGGLPIKSEGIAVRGDTLVIVTDGEAASSDGGACPTPGRLLIVDKPAL